MCDWKALRAQLRTSAYLDPADDLTTQRGIVATAAAIMERMSDASRETAWTPYRVLMARARKAAGAPSPLPPTPHAHSPGNAPVASPASPRRPLPGGMAVQPIDAFALEG